MLDRGRFVVDDAAWEKVAPLLPGKPTDPGATGRDNRLFLEAVLWRVRTGVPWRDLPGAFGKWNSVFQRFRRWVKGGVFERVFQCLSGEPDFEYALLGDKAFDADWLRADLDDRGAAAVIPPKANRRAAVSFDRDMYRWRHLIENTFAKLKEFRAVATRYDKTDTSYAATIQLAAAIIASR